MNEGRGSGPPHPFSRPPMTPFRVTRIAPSEITDEKHFWDRRTWLATMGASAISAVVPTRLPAHPPTRLEQADTPTPYDSVTGYNNFYEFTTDKEGVRDLARNFRTTPWTVSVEGEVRRPRRWSLEVLLRGVPVEEP